ncbi:MAG: hypothetical protein E6R13_01780 [Spirochaetes bacterium]|nr:MAG: hypothetical protein E6R13_01780 [Spirochaetota bacterium]
MNIIQGIPSNRVTEVLDYSYQFFSHVMKKPDFDYYMRNLANINWSFSVLLLDDEDNIKGAYILGNHQITSMLDAEEYIGLNGIEGVLLCVDESIRGLGYGNQLKDYPRSLGYDYIWGQQFIPLGNLNDWLKRRELVGQTEQVYITAEKYI